METVLNDILGGRGSNSAFMNTTDVHNSFFRWIRDHLGVNVLSLDVLDIFEKYNMALLTIFIDQNFNSQQLEMGLWEARYVISCGISFQT